MHSMTGYGRGQLSGERIQVLVEVQSVNKRQTEILTSIPPMLASLESDIRAKIGRAISRGRIIVTISVTRLASHVQPALDHHLANLYLRQFKQLQKELRLPGEITIETILRSPGVVSSSEKGLIDASARSVVESALDTALQELIKMRAKEGVNLHKDLARRVRSLLQAIAKIRKRRPEAVKRYREVLLERIKKVDFEIGVADERLAKEVALFAERSDFSEELTRLESHLGQFVETANKKESIGRTLEFISQEIGRELNTLSAKANDAQISQIVVHCKAELEKIREQVQNVE
ncbi:MAG TPA: YicC/YloC family endoribonuclease [Chthoniobacterales bacterium]|jgi:uncharacterized protein (TIGR00255 family)|nr:YicC/YloC family endoribonuclease [Chthoniobacterales bacterium]